LRVPFTPAVLEIPEDFLLFGIDRNRRVVPILETSHLVVDVLKLSVAVRVLRSFTRFAVTLQAVIGRVQQPSHRRIADRMALIGQFAGQGPRALAGPAQWRFGITARDRINQSLECRQQLGIFLSPALSASARATQAVGDRLIRMRRLVGQLGSSFANRRGRKAGDCGEQLHTTPTDCYGLRRGPTSPQSLVHERSEFGVLGSNPLADGCIVHSPLKPTIGKVVNLL
jgi:hypothetical protein